MKVINIISKLNINDDFKISDEALTINLTNKKKYKYTFWNSNKNRNMLRLPNAFSNEGLDLLYISLIVYYADRIIKREMFPDAWTRHIRLYIPVLSLDKWLPLKNHLVKLLSFLSGDKWEIEFRKRELNLLEKKFDKRKQKNKEGKLSFDKICMLSGGLDSFIGAIDLLEKKENIAFIGHYGGGKGVISYQNLLKEKLINHYSLSDSNFFNFYAAPVKPSKKAETEDTTRTRSFMFFSHAIVLASTQEKQTDLVIPENGLISLNIPLTNSRLGSSSTRTTHPYYMRMLQELFEKLGIPVKLVNPYQFKTKGEMIVESKNAAFLKQNIVNTMSCSHPDYGRYKGEKTSKHCGTCLPCLIRRAALKKANYDVEESNYRDKDFKLGEVAPKNLKTYKLGMAKFLKKSSISFLTIHKSGPIVDHFEDYASLYNRGMLEIKAVLDSIND